MILAGQQRYTGPNFTMVKPIQTKTHISPLPPYLKSLLTIRTIIPGISIESNLSDDALLHRNRTTFPHNRQRYKRVDTPSLYFNT